MTFASVKPEKSGNSATWLERTPIKKLIFKTANSNEAEKAGN